MATLKQCRAFYADFEKMNRNRASNGLPAIILPTCGTREFNILLKSLAKTSDYSLHTLKKVLSYSCDRVNTTGHKKESERAQKQYDPMSALPSGKSKAAGPNRRTRRAYGLYKV